MFVNKQVKYESGQKTYIRVTDNNKEGLAGHLLCLRLLSVTTIIVTQKDTKN